MKRRLGLQIFLAKTGQSIWQILPLNPTHLSTANSPYSSSSAFAGNALFIDLRGLVEDGLLEQSFLERFPEFPQGKIDYRLVTFWKSQALDKAFQVFLQKGREQDLAYQQFCEENKFWLEDFALFSSLKKKFQDSPWATWPESYSYANKEKLQTEPGVTEEIKKETFLQFVFHQQFFRLKQYCREKGVKLLGDIPIYVNLESADVWANQSLFKLDESGKPQFQTGVPPDYFSETGQLWGNPVYNWNKIEETGFSWWLQRVGHNLNLCDLVRIDHFRGLVSYWEVGGNETTAINGHWSPVPAIALMDSIKQQHPELPIVAEDLGVITEDVSEIMRTYGIPGMKVLQFAYGGALETNPYIQHNHIPNCLLYVGTHDNNTIRGWWEDDASDEEKKNLQRYLGVSISSDTVSKILIRQAMMSVSGVAILACQDLLDLDTSARMNKPGTTDSNWEWRLLPNQLDDACSHELSLLTQMYHRRP